MAMARTIKEIMTTEVRTASPQTSVREVARMMRAEDVGSIPVVQNKKLVGIVTDRDLALCVVAEGLPPSTPVEDAMTGQPHSVGPDMTVHRAAQLMQVHQIRRLPVCDENGMLIGVVSLADMATDVGGDDLKAETLEAVSTPSNPQAR